MDEGAELRSGAVHVWAVPLAVDAVQLQRLSEQLSPGERQRAEGFLRDEPRRNFVASRTALRTLLGCYLKMSAVEVVIESDANGKPRLAGEVAANGLTFNVAHSGELALVAIARSEIGVDVEKLRPVANWQELAAKHFHRAEIEAIPAVNPAERNELFLRCWTRKEAILKALGQGLAHSLDSFAVPLADGANCWVELPAATASPERPNGFWLQSLVPAAGYVAAVASADLGNGVEEYGYYW
jgi:4'-phosphopantetheinyl transferase